VPENTRRPRVAASSSPRSGAGSYGRSAGRSTSSRSSGRPSGRGSSRPSSSPRRSQPSALDLALDAALQAPAPPDTTFAELGLPAPLVAALAKDGMLAPFAIQTRTLPDALAGKDVLGRAQTGSGKTLGFGLPLLARLAESSGQRAERSPRGLVLVPTRELARQVADVLAPLARSIGVRLTTVYGGAPMGRQIDALRNGVDLVIATPGRLIDLMERGAARLDRVSIAVLDEADHMADLGFLPDVSKILDETLPDGQRMLFSATLDRGVDTLVSRYLKDPAIHAVASAQSPVELADHRVFVLPAADKVNIAAQIAARPARTLFFVRTKHGADRLARQLSMAGAPAAAIHGNLNQNQRQRALAGFTAGHPRVLVATDVAARGIHVDDVDLVVHFDPPNDSKDYLHRSGRTARAGASGTVLALVDPGQVRLLANLHSEAGVTPVSHRVQADHEAVVALAASGTPVPPPAPVQARPPRSTGSGRPSGPSRHRGASSSSSSGSTGGYRGTRTQGRPAGSTGSSGTSSSSSSSSGRPPAGRVA
jgi:superfamily II DNA/RNA helicase